MKLRDYYHAFLTTECRPASDEVNHNLGGIYYYRAGPSKEVADAIPQIKGAITNTGKFGKLVTTNGYIGQPGAIEVLNPSNEVFTLYEDEGSCLDLDMKLMSFSEKVDAAKIDYKPRGPNSNSFVRSAIEYLKIRKTSNAVGLSAPGWDDILPIY